MVGDVDGAAAEVTLSGDATIDEDGVLTITASAVETSNIKDDAVTNSKIGLNAVETDNIKNGAVTFDKLAADAVNTTQIADGAVTTTEILDGTVGTIDIAAGAISNVKLDKLAIPLSGFAPAGASVALGGQKLTGVGTPTANDDAATKKYVDDKIVNPTFNGTVTGNSTGTSTIAGFSAAVNAQTGAYTLTQADNGKVITFTSGTAVDLTIPSGLSVGFNCLIIQKGSGVVTLVNDTAVTLNSFGGLTKSNGIYSIITLVSPASNEFIAAGNMN